MAVEGAFRRVMALKPFTSQGFCRVRTSADDCGRKIGLRNFRPTFYRRCVNSKRHELQDVRASTGKRTKATWRRWPSATRSQTAQDSSYTVNKFDFWGLNNSDVAEFIASAFDDFW